MSPFGPLYWYTILKNNNQSISVNSVYPNIISFSLSTAIKIKCAIIHLPGPNRSIFGRSPLYNAKNLENRIGVIERARGTKCESVM